jgi:hypothetical protein
MEPTMALEDVQMSPDGSDADDDENPAVVCAADAAAKAVLVVQ